MKPWPRFRKHADGWWVTVDGDVVTTVTGKSMAFQEAKRLRRAFRRLGLPKDVKVWAAFSYVQVPR